MIDQSIKDSLFFIVFGNLFFYNTWYFSRDVSLYSFLILILTRYFREPKLQMIFSRYCALYIYCWTAWHEAFHMQYGITELEFDNLSFRPYKNSFKNAAISLLNNSDSKSASCFFCFVIIHKGYKILNNTQPHQITILFSQRLIPKHRHFS